jgi:hypothetical protein
LAYALARHTEFLSELVEGDPVLREPPRFEDAPLPSAEHGERRGERPAAVVELLACSETLLLVGAIVD